ncbi:MAG: serine/threonine-protein kinase [Planctomycetaceae bacterium]|nr:serine/threonine-protein kinase [Planctomycetaceae bacterium]
MATPNAPRPTPKPLDATQAYVPGADATFVPETTAAPLDATVVPPPHTLPPPARTQAGRSSTTVPFSSKAPAVGAPVGPNGLSQLGDFRIVKKLGQGGMGEVFLAHQISLDRPAALKVLAKHLTEKADFVKRFYREARAMAKIDHPNAVRVFAVDEAEGVYFVAMELVDGKSMQDWLNQLEKLSVGDAVHVTLRAAEALETAHRMNMVHRDVKPDNIMLTSRGQVKVSDFGLAKALDDEEMSMTQSGTGLGTPYYMAPEQARNAKHVDGRSDIYALGVTLYHFLSGQLPFTGNSAMEVLLAKEKSQAPPLRKFNPEIPDKLDLVVGKMIAKDPNQRFKDFGEVIRTLSGLGFENPSLSFIDAPDKFVVASASSAARSMPKVIAPPQATSKPAAAAPGTAPGPKGEWTIEYKNKEGRRAVSHWSTQQVLTAIRAGAIDNTAKAKKAAADAFVPLAQFPEFEKIIQGLLIKQRTEKKGSEAKKLYDSYGKQEFWWKVKKRFKGMTSGAMGLVTLLVYLGLIGGVLYGAYWGWTNYGRAKLQEALPKSPAAPPGAKAPAVPGPTQPTGQ